MTLGEGPELLMADTTFQEVIAAQQQTITILQEVVRAQQSTITSQQATIASLIG